jgi:hypothetical protein
LAIVFSFFFLLLPAVVKVERRGVSLVAKIKEEKRSHRVADGSRLLPESNRWLARLVYSLIMHKGKKDVGG